MNSGTDHMSAAQFFEEEQITLNQAKELLSGLPGADPVSYKTVWRWCTKGVGGIRLEAFPVGRSLKTTREALLRFFERTRTARLAQHEHVQVATINRSARQRERSKTLARQRLDEICGVKK